MIPSRQIEVISFSKVRLKIEHMSSSQQHSEYAVLGPKSQLGKSFFFFMSSVRGGSPEFALPTKLGSDSGDGDAF